MTTLDALFPAEGDGRRFTLYAHEADPETARWLSRWNADVERRRLPPGGPEPFLAIASEGEFVGAIPLATLETLLEPPVVRPGERSGVSEGYRVLFEAFDDTVYRALTRRELLAVSHEIEERAYRVGFGTLRVGFQRLSTFESRVDAYRHLATDTDLSVHVYGAADWTPPDIDGLSYHAYPDDALERYWVLAFLGGDGQTCGLVARETDDGYDGFWTDDEATTRQVLAALESG